MTNFDIIPSTFLNSLLFNMDTTDPINDRFNEMGFDSSNFIDNIGSFFYYNMIIGILLIIMVMGYFVSSIYP